MAHTNIGHLLREFEIHTPRDYHKLPAGRRSHFISLLFKTMEHETKRVLKELKEVGGLKLHFHVTHGHENDLDNIPTDVFIRKVAFFANKTIVTFPFREAIEHDLDGNDDAERPLVFGQYETKRTGYGGEIRTVGDAYFLRREEFEAFLKLICAARPFLEADTVNVLPSYYSTGKLKVASLQKRFGLVSANFHHPNLKRQFDELQQPTSKQQSYILNAIVYLPHFTNIAPRDVLDILRDERMLYESLQADLCSMLVSEEEAKREEDLLGRLAKIDAGVRKLTQKYEAIQAAWKRKNVAALLGFTAVGLGFLVPQEIKLALEGFLGSKSVLDYLDARNEENKARQEFKQDEFFLMWRVGNPGRRL